MEVLYFVSIIVLIILVVTLKSTLQNEMSVLKQKLDKLSIQLNQLNEKALGEKKTEEKTEIKKPQFEKPIQPDIVPPVLKETSIPITIQSDDAILDKVAFQQTVEPKIESVNRTTIRPTPPPSKPSFFERNPDLEKFIGENLINKIGIAILVLGIGFFVKYAISQNWINAYGRTAIGVLCGGILITLAHRLRNKFSSFSSVLVGGGLSVLYYTITIAFHEYHIFSQVVAFTLMSTVTLFAVILSIFYNKKELAVLAAIGGYTSPIMLSTGDGNYMALFTYMIILNSGMLVLAYVKKWKILHIISYGFTVIIYASWLMITLQNEKPFPYMGAFVFATIFYFIFFLMNIIQTIKDNSKLTPQDIIILLSNTFLYFAVGIFLLENLYQGQLRGLFTLVIAIINFLFCYLIYKKANTDRNLLYLLIGIILTFVSLTIPMQFKGNQITMFWAAESVLLLWMSQKTNLKIFKNSSLIILIIMLGSLILDWGNIYFNSQTVENELTPILNKGYITGLFVALSIFIYTLLIKKENKYIVLYREVDTVLLRNIAWFGLIILIYLVHLFELKHQANTYIQFHSTKQLINVCFNFCYITSIFILFKRNKILYLNELLISFSLLLFLLIPLLYNNMIIAMRTEYLIGNLVGSKSLMIPIILFVVAISLLTLMYSRMKNSSIFKQFASSYGLWFIVFISIYLASSILDHFILLLNYSPGNEHYIINQNHKIGFPVLWAISSFIVMYLGMKFKQKDLRIISLCLFLLIILKLFIVDIKGVSEGGKIFAFICLGIILLTVSFMYQKLKNLVLHEDKEIQTEITDEK
jgi:uncharacterized membrane protein